MSTLAEIEAALSSLSGEELGQVETALRRLKQERGLNGASAEADVRLDGLPWPTTSEGITALLSELDALPPLLTPEDADRFDAWRIAEKKRQEALSANSEAGIRQLFA